MTQNATIAFLDGGRIAPLTYLDVSKPGTPGTFDGGAYDATGAFIEAGLQWKGFLPKCPDDVARHRMAIPKSA
jgi:hypothetical protein